MYKAYRLPIKTVQPSFKANMCITLNIDSKGLKFKLQLVWMPAKF